MQGRGPPFPRKPREKSRIAGRGPAGLEETGDGVDRGRGWLGAALPGTRLRLRPQVTPEGVRTLGIDRTQS